LQAVPYCLDTNILLYAFSRSKRDAAKARIARDWLGRLDWAVPVQVLKEFYVNVIRPPHTLDHAEATAMIEEIAEARPIVASDLALLRHALRITERHGISYWDAAIVAGALRLGAHTLVTEDLSNGQDYGGIRVLNPFV
jgi:predicted nucleic acid-binding protein